MRLKLVASYVKEKSTILDLACGGGYLSSFLPTGCKYYGVDRVPSGEKCNFSDFLTLDLLEEGSVTRIRQWLPVKPHYITCIAFLEHIANPARVVSQYSSLLDKGGRIIGTTPHPSGRLMHDFLSKVSLCSAGGTDEHETFLGKKEIEALASRSNGTLTTYKRFLFGLNQLFVIEYS